MTIVNRLAERGYITRARATHDGRRQALALTESGASALASAKAGIIEHETWLKARFTADEVKNLVEMLKRIHD